MAKAPPKRVTKKTIKNDPKPGAPKRAHRDFVSGGKNLNKDTRRELREKH
jgi:hypothetical protein